MNFTKSFAVKSLTLCDLKLAVAVLDITHLRQQLRKKIHENLSANLRQYNILLQQYILWARLKNLKSIKEL